MKHYHNPYQKEYWDALKEIKNQKEETDNEVAYWMIKFTAFLLAIGVVFLLLKR